MHAKAPAVSLGALAIAAALAAPAQARVLCPSDPSITPLREARGAAVPDAEICKFFVRRNPDEDGFKNAAIRSALLSEGGTTVRSIAVIIGVDSYADGSVDATDKVGPAISRDVIAMKQELITNQKFDEVLEISGVNATRRNMELVLSEYLGNPAFLHGTDRTRVLVVYSGHGLSEDSTRNWLVPHDADIATKNNMVSMLQFAGWIQQIADGHYQVLTLLNACHAGGVLKQIAQPSSGFQLDPSQPGSWLIGAAAPDMPAFVYPPDNNASTSQSALLYKLGRILDTFRVEADSSILGLDELIYRLKRKDDVTLNPFFGSIAPPNADQRRMDGSFFFVRDAAAQKRTAKAYRRASNTKLIEWGAEAVLAPVDWGWDLVKTVFAPTPSAPDEHRRGATVSARNGTIDWTIAARDLSFAYIEGRRDGTGDAHFAENWAGANAAGLQRGVYVVYDPCAGAEAELAGLAALAPESEIRSSLPVAIDMKALAVDIAASGTDIERTCAGGRRLPSARALLADADAFLAGVTARYDERPLVVGSAEFLTNARLRTPHHNWVRYLDSSKDADLAAAFSEPAALWLYDARGAVAGIAAGDVSLSYVTSSGDALAGLTARNVAQLERPGA